MANERLIVTTPYGEPLQADNEQIAKIIHLGDLDGKHFYSVPKTLKNVGTIVFNPSISELDKLMIVNSAFIAMNAEIRSKYSERQEQLLQRKQDETYLKFIAELQTGLEANLSFYGFTA